MTQESENMKLRPVLVLTGPIGHVPEVLVGYISSVIPNELLPSDMLLDPALPQFRSTQLKTTSALLLHKLATIHCTSLVRYLGHLETEAWLTVSEKLTRLLGH